jgi:hypothetical protein
MEGPGTARMSSHMESYFGSLLLWKCLGEGALLLPGNYCFVFDLI